MAEFSHGFRDGIDINLGVGYVNEATIPAQALAATLETVAAAPDRYRQAFNYGSPAGSANLHAAIRRFLLSRPGALDGETLHRQSLAIGACGATSLLDALASVIEPGIVVTSDPSYYIYTESLERQGFEILAIPEDGDGPRLDVLEAKLAAIDPARIAFFYFVTVNNPSCTLLSNQRRIDLYNIAARVSRGLGRRVPFVCDLAYELLLHDPSAEPFASVLPHDRDLGIAYEIGTLSKVLAPALRIGYILGPAGPLMNAMVQRTADTGFSAPLFVQEMSAWMLDHAIGPQLQRVNEGYRAKAEAVRLAIDGELGPALEECRGGRAGFYFYLTFRDMETHPESAFFRFLAGEGRDPGAPRVVYIPGQYCVHARGDLAAVGRRQLRLSYGFEETGRIVRAIALMRRAAAFARGGHETVIQA